MHRESMVASQDSHIRLSVERLHCSLDLYPILGLTAPTYDIGPLSPAAPNIVSGAAMFQSSPLFPKPLGEVRNVYGRKNAKEECAKGVWKALSDLARSRGINIDEMED
jgi:hypothetical protein